MDAEYIWVDGKGNFIKKYEPKDASRATTSSQDTLSNAESAAARGAATANLWRRINPGCMEDYTTLPSSSYDRNFTFGDVNDQHIREKNWEYHNRKTDFSEYTEAAVRHNMKSQI